MVPSQGCHLWRSGTFRSSWQKRVTAVVAPSTSILHSLLLVLLRCDKLPHCFPIRMPFELQRIDLSDTMSHNKFCPSEAASVRYLVYSNTKVTCNGYRLSGVGSSDSSVSGSSQGDFVSTFQGQRGHFSFRRSLVLDNSTHS